MKIITFIRHHFLFCLGMLMFLILLFFTFFGEYLPGIDRDLKEIEYIWTDKKIPLAPPYEPSEDYLLGTDRDGRDLLSLIVMGAKETLLIIISITIIRYIIAIPLAFMAHKKSLGIHHLVSWMNGFLSYIPSIILVILLVTLPPILTSETRLLYLIIVLAALEVGRVAEMFRLEFSQIASKEFVTGGNSIGVSNFRLFRKYLLPFLYGKLLISLVGDIGKVTFLLGQIGFLGIFITQVFVQVDAGQFAFFNTSLAWPMLLLNSYNDIRSAIWIPFFPALAMTYVIFTFNILSQGIQKLAK
ncbi:peptide ABC transporter permease [Bacillaceae bacterium CLA-AA-H227]|uniref:Peptide ABC transporter permease n=1 Tax=Robertmurraya yapensis (ex Hitch et al 2024) TaxID=3133160 RepID=A0ACC6S9S7_9BACI